MIPSPTDPAPSATPAQSTPTPLTAEHAPSPTPFPWLLAFDSDVEGNDEIYLLPADGGAPVNLTRHPAEDRHPSWLPDGEHIVFQSNRDGNWEIYTLNVKHHTVRRLTFHLAYDGAPFASPDGQWIVFESYRDTSPCQFGTPVPDPPPCPDLEIYRVALTDGKLERLTHSPGGDYQPVVSPDGRWMAFTSWRDGDKEIYVLPVDGGPARNLTDHTADDWSPAWTPDGEALVFLSERDGTGDLYRQPLAGGPAMRISVDGLPKERPTLTAEGELLFARYDPGSAFEAYDPYRPGAFHLYWLSPGGSVPRPVASLIKTRRSSVFSGTDLGASVSPATGKAFARPIAAPPALTLQRLDDVQAPDPCMVAGVDDAFRAWRAAVLARSGHDYLGRVSDIFRPAAFYRHRLGYLSWHKTGRAVDLLFDWFDAEGKTALYVVREDIAGEIYWRLYLKCAVQDGSLGEPLTQAPWYFWWHAAQPLPDGGYRLPIPAGYFIDVTALADRYGWSRIAAYDLDDFDWQRDSTATEYWHYQHIDGLTWHAAMAQIYPLELLDELFNRAIAADREQTEEVMDGKGLPQD